VLIITFYFYLIADRIILNDILVWTTIRIQITSIFLSREKGHQQSYFWHMAEEMVNTSYKTKRDLK
jgi:hypothetical protein